MAAASDAIWNAKQWLLDNEEPSKASGIGGQPATFLPPREVLAHFDKSRIAGLLKNLYPDGDYTTLAHRITTQHYIFVFLALFRSDQPRFVQRFLNYPALSDRHEVVTADSLRRCIPGLDVAEYLGQLRAFHPTRFQLDMDIMVDDEDVLPIIFTEHLENGTSAEIQHVRIHPQFDELGQTAQSGNPHEYIFKVFDMSKPEARDYHEREKKAYEILRSTAQINSLLRYYGSFTYRGKAYLILEYASEGTLEDFMMMQKKRPEHADEWAALYDGLLGLGEAVLRIHEHGGVHQDIQPLNIVLRKRQPEHVKAHHAADWSYDFILLDHGHSVFRRGSRADLELSVEDTYGGQIYGAPQVFRSNSPEQTSARYITQDIDVFSCGAVWLEVLVWLISGSVGVMRFRDDRCREASRARMEKAPYFHKAGSDIMNSVDDMLIKLKGHAIESHPLTSLISRDLISDMLRVNYRKNSMDVCREARRLLQSHEPTVAIAQSMTNLRLNGPSIPRPSQFATGTGDDAYSRDNRADSGSSYGPVDPFVDFKESSIGLDCNRQPGPSTRVTREMTPPQGPGYAYTMESSIDGSSPPADASPKARQTAHGLPTALNAQPRGHVQWTSANFRESNSESGGTRNTSVASTVRPPEARDVPRPAQPPQIIVPRLQVADLYNWFLEGQNGRTRSPLSDEVFCKRKLRDRDHVFLLDSTFNTFRYWKNMCWMLYLLATVIQDCDDDGMEVRFTTSDNSMIHRDPKELFDCAQRVTPSGRSDMERALNTILDPYRRDMEAAHNAGDIKKVKPLTIYILTDGKWDLGEPDALLLFLTPELTRYGVSREQIGMQFISFGDDPDGLQMMRRLDNASGIYGTNYDLIDTEPSTGNVWKMLLGAIDPVFDEG